MKGRDLFAIDEWYHCYSRGVDKRTVFQDEADYKRFKNLLFLSNSNKAIHLSDISKESENEIYQINRDEPLVAIGAYCLMPNHFHLLLKEIKEGGISEFMRKVGIGYAMYFNKKNDRIGNLFVKPFRAKHVAEDGYFKRVAQYIHLNPAELFEPGWKQGRISSLVKLEEKIRSFKHSSLPDYLEQARPESGILDLEAFELIGTGLPSLEEVLSESLFYYHDLAR